MDEPVVFETGFEGLFRSVGTLGPTLQEQLRAVGVDLTHPLQSGYPLQVWVKTVHLVATATFPAASSHEEALRLLGRRFLSGYQQTVLGNAVVAAGRLLGIHRVLARMTRNFRGTNNYMETELHDINPTIAELTIRVSPTMNEHVRKIDGFKGFFTRGYYVQGILEAICADLGYEKARVEVVMRDEEKLAVRYRLDWSNN